MDSSYFGEKENASELVLAHWLSGTLLWERIRTTGGAYGAYASSSNLTGNFGFSTYRDPSPEKSVETFVKCLEDASNTELSAEECQRSITGAYGDEIQPHSPQAKGYTGFFRLLYCIDEEDKKEKLTNLIAVKPEDIKNSAKKLYAKSSECRKVVIGNKTLKNTSVNINLPL